MGSISNASGLISALLPNLGKYFKFSGSTWSFKLKLKFTVLTFFSSSMSFSLSNEISRSLATFLLNSIRSYSNLASYSLAILALRIDTSRAAAYFFFNITSFFFILMPLLKAIYFLT
jgi:hypothetical protein